VGSRAIGRQIAGWLLCHGNPVYGANRTRSRADRPIGRGPRRCETPRQVIEAVDATT
jgi:3-hydroxyisobutyrate dehydrogenase-like beta-hydroxyacid dehydrogenase